jgi:hypothetical protein
VRPCHSMCRRFTVDGSRLALLARETRLVRNLSMRPADQTKRESRVAQYRGNVFDRAVYLIPNYRALEDLELHDVCHWDVACRHDVSLLLIGTNDRTRSIDGTATRAVAPDVDCRMSSKCDTYSSETHTVRHICASGALIAVGDFLPRLFARTRRTRCRSQPHSQLPRASRRQLQTDAEPPLYDRGRVRASLLSADRRQVVLSVNLQSTICNLKCLLVGETPHARRESPTALPRP